MAGLYKTRALVLRRYSCGEHNEVLHLLTPYKGRVDALVRGSKRVQSPFVGRVEPFVEFEGLFAKGRNLSYLTQVETIYGFPLLRQDYNRLCWGSFLLDLFADSVHTSPSAPREYAMLVRLLHVLEASSKFRLTCCWALWSLLYQEGLCPNCGVCTVCGTNAVCGFSYSEGGVVCSACLQRTKYLYGEQLGVELPPLVLVMLRRMSHLTLEKSLQVEVPRADLCKLQEVLWGHWCYTGHREVRSQRLLDSLD